MKRGAAAALSLVLVAAVPSTGAARALFEAPPIFPVPRVVHVHPYVLSLPSRVRLVTSARSDPSAVSAAHAALEGAGIDARPATPSKASVYIGRSPRVERTLGVATSAGLPPGGYVLAAGRSANGRIQIVLDGVDRDGQYNAAQTFRQLFTGGTTIQAIAIRDWPSFPLRGVAEGYYGTPWAQEERLSALDFLGAHKLNLYQYGPKEDALLRDDWAEPFPASYLAQLSDLARRAAFDHVRFSLMISPGLSICYSSAADQDRLIAKLQSAWEAGVRSFTLALDDIDLTRASCTADAAFGSGDAAVAAAQASLINAVNRRFIATHAHSTRLIVVPTEYHGVAPTQYTTALAAAVDPDVVVQWTGRYGISVVVHDTDALAAHTMFSHPLMLWDNFYVTDYSTGFIALGAFDGHDESLPSLLLGLAADPMVQPEASRIGLFTVSDYSWNSSAYDPAVSWQASLLEFAGGDDVTANALRVFADANWGSPLNPVQSPDLASAVRAFWAGWRAGDRDAPACLDIRLAALQSAPAVLRARLHNAEFLTEVSPWLDATAAWAAAARTALAGLVARHAGDTTAADADARALPALIATARSYRVGPTEVQITPRVLAAFVTAVQAA